MGNDGLPEAVLNAGGSVWDIDTLVRPGSRNLSSISGGREGSGGAGNEWDMCLAVATGPLRQTDEPLDEVRKSDYRESRWRMFNKNRGYLSPIPLLPETRSPFVGMELCRHCCQRGCNFFIPGLL